MTIKLNILDDLRYREIWVRMGIQKNDYVIFKEWSVLHVPHLCHVIYLFILCYTKYFANWLEFFFLPFIHSKTIIVSDHVFAVHFSKNTKYIYISSDWNNRKNNNYACWGPTSPFSFSGICKQFTSELNCYRYFCLFVIISIHLLGASCTTAWNSMGRAF